MKSWHNARKVIHHIGLKSIIAAVIVFLLTVAATSVGGYQLYQNTKEGIVLQGEVSATRSARAFDSYLLIGKNAVYLSGNVVNNMIQGKRSNDEILAYLTEESRSIDATLNDEYVGLYGWINGEYLDGAGWVPDPDYVATERPWYIEAMADNSDVTFVRPYMDAQTHTIATTMAMTLCDKVSVLALDVDLTPVQEITSRVAKQTPGSYGLVMDKTGQVVAHSDAGELSKNYFEEKGTLGAKLADEVLVKGKKQFEFTFDRQSYMVYVEDIEGGWESVSMINTKTFYRPLQIILALLIFFMLLEAIVFGMVFYNLSTKNLAIAVQNVQISAVADMYMAIFDIDIDLDRIREIRRQEGDDTSHVIGDLRHGAQGALDEMIARGVSDISRPIMDPFVDLSTLADRLADTETVAEEFLNNRERWCRARFIAAERDEKGEVIRALWMVESIHEEKQHRDNLKFLSETDRMTGLYNRTAGEEKIAGMLKRGDGGMLAMADVDQFKSINDSLGHDVGDKVIIATANAIGSAFRSSDVVMRLGGDEFVAFAPGVKDEEIGTHLIERMFDNIEEAKVEELGERRVHVSVGAAFCPGNTTMTFGELYKLADDAVYISKKKKGNALTYSPPARTSDERHEGGAQAR